MKKKFAVGAIILIVLLIFRAITQFIIVLSSGAGGYADLILIILGILYSIAVLGVLSKKKWGAILVIVIALIDIMFALLTYSGSSSVGSTLFDLILLLLGSQEYNRLP